MYFSSQVRSLFWAQNLFCSIELMCSELSLWLVALETHTVLFRCEEREREREREKWWWREGEGRWGMGCTGKSKKRKINESRLARVEGGWAIFSQHRSLPLSLSLPLFLSLSLSVFSYHSFPVFVCWRRRLERRVQMWEKPRERGKKGMD